jgi:hypothetical protein
MTRPGVPFRLIVFWRCVVQLAHIILSRNCGWLTALIAMGSLIALFKSVLPKLSGVIAEVA